jgi:hypothetical protein
MVYGALKAGVDFISQSGTKNLASEKGGQERRARLPYSCTHQLYVSFMLFIDIELHKTRAKLS